MKQIPNPNIEAPVLAHDIKLYTGNYFMANKVMRIFLIFLN